MARVAERGGGRAKTSVQTSLSNSHARFPAVSVRTCAPGRACLPEPPHRSPQPIWSSLQPLAKLNLCPESLLFQPSLSQAGLGADALPPTEWKGRALLAALLPAWTGIWQPVLPDALPPSGRALPAPASLAAPGLNRRPAEQ